MNLIYRCLRPECRFRFPATEPDAERVKCPRCGGTTQLVVPPYEGIRVEEKTANSSHHVEVLLDNIRSAFNVGSIFRTADGAAISHIHLCGITPTPDHPKVAKTALGTECLIAWTQHWDGVEAAKNLKEKGCTLIALESARDSRSLFDSSPFSETLPSVLVVGNEITGVDPGILYLCDQKIHIPMLGSKRSLNVAIAFGIAVYYLRFGMPGYQKS